MGTKAAKIEVKNGTRTFKYLYNLPWTIDLKY